MANVDLQDIIDTMIAEAAGEGPEGMRRVAETMINRSALRGLPLADVARQPKQYTGFKHPGAKSVQDQQNPAVRQTALEALQLAFQPGDPTAGADHYLNPKQANPNWANQLPTTGDYGDHRFFASRAIPPEALARVLSSGADLFGPRVAPTPASTEQQMAARGGNVLNGTFGSGGALPPAMPRPRPTSSQTASNLGDLLAMAPVAGGRQSAPLFDAAFDTRTGAMRLTGQPIDSQGMAAFSSTPAQMAEAYAASAVGGPPTTRTVRSVPFSGSNSDPVESMPDYAELADIFSPRASTAGATRTANPLAGRAAMPAGVRPNVPSTAPSTRTSSMDPIESMPGFSDLADMFGPRVPGPSGTTVANKNQDRLAPTSGSRGMAAAPGPDLFGGIDPRLAGVAPVPRPAREAEAARAPKPATRTVTEQVLNPEWTAAQRIDPVLTMPSWDDFQSTFAPKKQAPQPPKFITVKRTVPVPAAPRRVAPVPAQRSSQSSNPLRITVQGARTSGGSAVDQLRAQGYSPSQAYEMANSNARSEAIANSSNPSGNTTRSRLAEQFGFE